MARAKGKLGTGNEKKGRNDPKRKKTRQGKSKNSKKRR